ncbi:hypothetical protein [Brachyspira aalborgi]|uniref:Uncharacterized protein n=1 Tax=Brachyspira aalborgi TaxID=29522 RepID=A0A5C8EF72_9SPIR|nr:hypothetical protein [Brachyspira aalborgi]TXJ35322.1 hypothetical protein EPJ78_10380 [Brachyspira aalborgi]
MEKLAKYNIDFIVAAISSLVIISMSAYMILNSNTIIMKILIILEFLCSFYFVSVFFYRISKYSRIELFFYLITFLIPFMMSILGIFYALNFFSLNRVFLKENIISSFLTRGYHFLFIFYITHIIYFFYLFVLENKKSFYSSISSHFIIIISAAMAIIFIIIYAVLNWIFDNNIIKSYQNTKNEIIYEADTTFYREHNSEGFEYESFAKSLNIALLYYDNELKYQSDNWDEFESKHLLFETAIIQGNGFFIMISGKQFIYPFYMFILIYIIVNSIVLTFSIIFFKIFLEQKFNSYIDIIIKGFEEENFIYAINTDNMDETEIKTLSKLYNKKLLAYKYRERYIKMFTK